MMFMNYARLEKNLTDNIKEAILKLGYDNRPMSLNYTGRSLAHLIGGECTEDVLAGFAEYVKSRLRELSFRAIKDGWCVTVSAEGTSYVNSLTGYNFLSELISAVRNHGTAMEQVLGVFRKYSADITVKEVRNDEFDLLVYGVDEYYYCLTDEGCHVTYHRFIREDYEDLGF